MTAARIDIAPKCVARLLADGTEKPVRKVAVTFGTAERNIVKWVST